ncbi:hypothetical protein QW180_27430 [Vibrio sinaloensis]|nr:hypothetical protein [Vibrio sinaloensis]
MAANSMAGDVIDPREDRTSHFDQYSGRLLVEVTWQDYSVFAKLMAAGVSLHQGDLSFLNKVLNVLFLFGVCHYLHYGCRHVVGSPAQSRRGTWCSTSI